MFQYLNVLKSASVLMGIKLAIAGLSLLTYVLLARMLSIDEFGLLSVIMTIAMFMIATAKFGYENAVVRFFAQYKDAQLSGLYRYFCCLFIYSNLATLAIFYITFDLIIDFFHEAKISNSLFYLMFLFAVFQSYLAFNSSVLKGRGEAYWSLIFSGLITQSGVVCYLLFLGVAEAETAFLIFVSCAAISLLLSFFVVSNKLALSGQGHIKCDPKDKKLIFKVSRTLFVSAFAALVSQQCAILILAKFSSVTDVAIFNVALKISLVMGYPLLVVNAMMASKYATLYKNNDITLLKSLAQLSSRILMLLGGIGFALIVFFASDMVLIFGDGYADAAQLLIILAFGQVVNLSCGSVVTILVMAGYEKFHRTNSLFHAILTIVLLYIFVPLNGVLGAAYVMTFNLITFNIAGLIAVYYFIYPKSRAVE